MRKAISLVLFICWAWFLSVVEAQPYFNLQRFSVNDGLSQGIVQDILQDRNGYIWFSTWNGLNKYDGSSFRFFKSHPGEGAALSSNRIVQLAENASGDIWCCTQERFAYLFDRRTETFVDVMKSFVEDNPSLHIDKIVCLDNNVTWLLSSDHICFRVDETRLGSNDAVRMYDRNTKGWHAGNVSQIKLDGDGNEWILTDQGVNIVGERKIDCDYPFRYMTEKNSRIWLIAPNGQMAEYTSAGVRFLEQARGVQKVYQMKAISDTLLTVGTDAGLWLVHIPDGRMEQIDTRSVTKHSADVTSVFKDSRLRLWMFTHDPGIVMYDLNTKQLTHLQPPVMNGKPGEEVVNRIFVYEDEMGVIRVNPRNGYLSYYDPETNSLKPYVGPDGTILKPVIRMCLIDRQKNIWYGSVRNLYHLAFFHSKVDYLPGLKGVEVRCLFVDKQEKLWVGAKDGYLRIYADEHFEKPRYLRPDGRFSNEPVKFLGNVYCMYQDADGNLWMGTRGQGLVMASPLPGGAGYVLKRFTVDAGDEFSISSNDIYSILQDHHGNLWIGTYMGGLNLLQKQGGRYQFIHGGNRLKNYPFPYMKSKVRSLAEASDGTLLVGASEGLLTFSTKFDRPEQIKFHLHTAEYDRPEGLNCTEIMNVCVTHSGIYLATSTGGFNEILSENLSDSELRFHSFGVRDGWLSDLALSIIESSPNDLWFVTENYLIHYNKEKSLLVHYGNTFFHDEVFFSEASPVCMPDGRILFATTDHGAFFLSPKRLQSQSYTPPLVFTGLRVRGRSQLYPLDNVDEVVLRPDERYVTFQFAALDYANSSGIQYAYRLRGLDKDWIYCGNLRSANYNNLPPGEYVLEIRSTNGDGMWTDHTKSLTVIIQPTFWETPWAWAIYVLALLGLVFLVAYILFYIYRLRHKVDVEQQLSEVKLRFFTDISHELRTPLTLIVSPIDEVLAREKNLSVTARAHLELVQKNVNRMLRLVNQLLDFRKIQSRKMKLLVEETDLVRLFARVADSFYLLAEERDITYRFVHKMPELKAWVDRDKFEKVCYNLLSNAFKYTENGGNVVLELAETDKTIDVMVRDTGVGIAPDKMNSLFERFETLASRSWSQPSSGIGLSLVKEYIELHHATISVSSTVGEGSVFTIHLQKGKAHFEKDSSVEFLLTDTQNKLAEPVDDLTPDAAEEPKAENEILSVLVVEDNDELRAFLSNILSEDYKVFVATNGREGLDVVHAQSPDLIVSDVMMPVMDGLEMVRQIKADPSVCHIPIIILTAKSSLEDRITGLEQGIDDYITKPFSASYLKVKIHNLLAKRKQWQEMYRELLMKKEQTEFQPAELHITSYDKEFMEHLMDFIEQNMDNTELKIEQMAEHMNLSRAVFYTKLKAISGLSPIDFLRDIRIKRACQLIDSGNYTMAQIAYMTGFKDPKFFSRTFRKIMECSPTEYKDRAKVL